MAEIIIDKGMSVRQLKICQKAREGHHFVQPAPTKPKDRDLEILEEELRKILGTKVFIEDKKGKGKLILEYYTLMTWTYFRDPAQMKQSVLVLIKPDGCKKPLLVM